jgi:hypothetical protein
MILCYLLSARIIETKKLTQPYYQVPIGKHVWIGGFESRSLGIISNSN